MSYKVVVTDDRHGFYEVERDILRAADAELEVRNLASEEEAIEVLGRADAILNNLFPLTKRVIDSLSRCKVISKYGIGMDNVDVDSATKAGIWVARVPDYAAEDVSDHAAALVLAVERGLCYRDAAVRRGDWNIASPRKARRLKGRVLGVLGYGSIGRAFVKKMSGFGFAKIMVCDPNLPHTFVRGQGVEPVDFKTLLASADYLSIHIPLVPETRHLLGHAAFEEMKEGVVIINTARGGVLDTEALVASLRTGRVSGAGLDVFEEEPLPADSPLRDFPGVVLTDHCAYLSEESIIELKSKAAKNVLEVLKGGAPVTPVNKL